MTFSIRSSVAKTAVLVSIGKEESLLLRRPQIDDSLEITIVSRDLTLQLGPTSCSLFTGITIASASALYVGGMTPFDAICHAFSTVATGGFSTHDASAGHYASSSFILLSMTFFMLAGGTSFAILHRALTQKVSWRQSPELRAYLGIFAVAALLMAWNLRAEMPEQFGSWPETLQHALFQSAAILTTTGLTSSDFDTWPFFCHAVLFSLFFVGGMAGSTGGGVKVIRVLILVRLSISQFVHLVHPRSFGVIKLGEKTIDDQIILSVLGFMGLWIISIAVGTLILASLGSDLDTSLIAASAALGNIGPGFGAVAPSVRKSGRPELVAASR